MASASKSQEFPLVGVGASAGGIDSFKRFLGAVPEDSGMAFILVQHLSPTHESTLPEILSRTTSLPVHEITDDVKLEPNHIYVIPENKLLEVTDHMLKLTPRKEQEQHMPIDKFFSSLARVHGPMAVGVILSGTARDGTVGLRDIKEHGGITFVEDPESATWDGMPRNALKAGVVDFVLAPEDIPSKLQEVIKAYSGGKDTSESLDSDGLKKILSLIRRNSGVDFSYYKKPTVLRRIDRRMAINQMAAHEDYFEFLRDNKTEQQFLFQDLLIKVTSFFRDAEVFEELEKKVFPQLMEGRSEENSLRIWVVGCASGEEAYSLAISLFEVLNDAPPNRNQSARIQIFASDISEQAIKKARTGIYTATELQPLSENRLQRYFTRTDGNYKVVKSIRDTIVFTVHNFLKDPPFGNVDLISCRNVFIYLDQFLQKKALSTFHYSLRENGFLLMGKSETTGKPTDLFVPFSKNAKIYSRKSGSGRFVPATTTRKSYTITTADTEKLSPKSPETDFRKSAESVLVSDYTPASIIVDEHYEIVHINGNVEPFVGPSSGRPTHELMKRARKELAFELRNSLHKAKDSQEKVVKRGIPVKIEDDQFTVDIEIVSLKDTVELHFLILFWKRSPNLSLFDKFWKTLEPSLVTSEQGHVQKRNTALEKELEQLREDMRNISEEQEAYNEELQSANEELLSSNEEMQSLNEELETSKEELQSTNEELIVVNRELLEKQDELNDTLDYLDDIISTMREPFLVLDDGFHIQKANTAYYQKFGVEEIKVEGKPFFQIQEGLWNIEVLHHLLHKILPKDQNIRDEEIVFDLKTDGKRTFLFNARRVIRQKDLGKLILVSITDITQRKEVERNYLTTIEELNRTNEQLDQFVHVASHDLQEPLRKITTFATRIIEKGSDITEERMETYLGKITSSSARMSSLIKNMLNYARLANHEQMFERTDLNAIIKNILSDFELMIEQKNAVLDIGPLPVLEAIPLQLNQLFYNLVSNALKFSKDNVAPVISISARKLLAEEKAGHESLNSALTYYELVVKDNGIGFGNKYRQQIFTIFQRLNPSSQYLGTGIGLALCKKIAENHHGEIFARSEEGKGAAFHILLPVEQPVHK